MKNDFFKHFTSGLGDIQKAINKKMSSLPEEKRKEHQLAASNLIGEIQSKMNETNNAIVNGNKN